MFLVVNPDGKFWDGFGWNQQGKEFLSIAGALRSLHEEGEGFDDTTIVDTSDDTPTIHASWDFTTLPSEGGSKNPRSRTAVLV